jgi:glutamate dehydrogenase (NAD(P)+)
MGSILTSTDCWRRFFGFSSGGSQQRLIDHATKRLILGSSTAISMFVQHEFERFCDDFGPAKIVHLYDPATGMRGVVVVDNTACGPSIGGVRMVPDVTTAEVFRLARAMTLKNAAAGLPHGGGKAGILADPRSPDKPAMIRAFARAIRDLTEYIPGPDMGTDESCMAWIHSEIGRAVGLPRVFGGIPLDEIGATGYGLAQCAEVAAKFCDLELAGATFAIEGFGNVGRHAAKILGAIGSPDGRCQRQSWRDLQSFGDPDARSGGGSPKVRHRGCLREGESITQSALLTVPCDILVPAARPDTIRADNARAIQARLILQGANIPATPEAESVLHQKGILSVPDFIANAGGVICASVEYHGGSQSEAFAQIAEKIRHNTEEVLTRSRDEKMEPRLAALQLAQDRVRTAMKFRGQG